MSTIIENLKSKVAAFPTKSGVYLMKNFDGEIIYIGKAKDLRARVRTYVSNIAGDGRFQIKFLMEKVASIDYMLTEHEEEALLLERELIHRHKPRYNIKLKDDTAYISIRINRSHPFPRIETVRRIIPDGSEYFGPFPSTSQIRQILEVIKRVVPLRTCTDHVFSNRVRPCLEYEIKRCAGPCCLPIDQGQYQEWLKQAVDIIEGNLTPTLESMERQMQLAAEDMRFEEAAAIRDRITILQNFRDRGTESIAYNFSCDVFALYRENDLAIVGLLKTRSGRMHNVETFALRDVMISDEELLESVVQQYYEIGHDIPTEILLSKDLPDSSLLAEFFENKVEQQPQIVTPQMGARARLVKICELNAKQAFQNKFFSDARFDAISNELVERFKLRQAPRRIECIDISNLQGSDIVGALVSFIDGIPDRKGYRRYTISFSGEPNDFEAIYEVVSRRLKHRESLPDLLIIDGGPQQLAKALQARDEQGVLLDIISLAKIKEQKSKVTGQSVLKPERIFLEGEKGSIDLSETDPLTYFLQRIRDAVHDYVIRYHRQKRKARVFKSALDDISGIGPERKQRLLNGFGSIDNIRDAPIEDLARVGRMSPLLAKKIKERLSNTSG